MGQISFIETESKRMCSIGLKIDQFLIYFSMFICLGTAMK